MTFDATAGQTSRQKMCVVVIPFLQLWHIPRMAGVETTSVFNGSSSAIILEII
jgi:hypothetical protein